MFSFEPVETGFFDKPNWVERKFRLTLWCEHSKLPLNHPDLSGPETKNGVYEVTLTREWLKKSAPVLKFLSGTLSLALPIASSAAKLAMDDASYDGIEEQLDFGSDCADGFLDGSEKVGGWLTSSDDTELDSSKAVRANGSTLRELHALLKNEDPNKSFGGLIRVQNKRREYLWVHRDYVDQY